MKLVSSTPSQIDKSRLWLIAIAQDSSVYYGAIVDPITLKCWVEHVGVSMAKENITGYFIMIPSEKNDEEWKAAVNFFEKHKVFSKFLEGKDWLLSRTEGHLTKAAEEFVKRLNA